MKLKGDTRAQKPVACHFWLFLFNHILHCSCFKIHFTERKYLASSGSYTRLNRTIKKVKKSIKKFMIFPVIIILCNHYFIILLLFQAIKFFILNQIKQRHYHRVSTSQLMANSWRPAELKNCK